MGQRTNIIDDLHTPEGFNRAMENLVSTRPTRPPWEKSLRFYLGVARWFEPGEKSHLVSSPFQQAFFLDYVTVPEEATFDAVTKKVMLFFRHEHLVMDKKIPASLILNEHAEQVQKLDLYPKHLYEPNETMDLGVFENADEKALWVKAVIVGFCQDLRRSATS